MPVELQIDQTDNKTFDFLRRAYKQFYFKNSQTIETPTRITEREFGYIPFGEGMIRHLSFKTGGELVARIVKEAPSSVYCSNAHYFEPTSPIEEKGWKGAELIFDIDADMIPTLCKKDHDVWICLDCSAQGKLPAPPLCPKCRGKNLNRSKWVCVECMDAAKEHTARLIKFLVEDFQVAESNIALFFSGNRGFHVHVCDERFEPLGAQGRAEITDYVRGTGMSILVGVLSIIKSRNSTDYREVNKRSGWFRRIGQVMTSLKGDQGAVKTTDRKNAKNVRRVSAKRIAERTINEYASIVDPSVTNDLHRIFRLPGTLHGTTGMQKVRVISIASFNPLVDPVVLPRDLVRVKILLPRSITLNGMKFGPFRSETLEIPTFAAVYFIGKGLALVA
jgi:DNA primase small subunit